MIKVTVSAPPRTGKTVIIRILAEALEKYGIPFEVTEGSLASCKDGELKYSAAWVAKNMKDNSAKVTIEADAK